MTPPKGSKKKSQKKRKYTRSQLQTALDQEFAARLGDQVAQLTAQLSPLMSKDIDFDLLSTIRYDPLISSSIYNPMFNIDLCSPTPANPSSQAAFDHRHQDDPHYQDPLNPNTLSPDLDLGLSSPELTDSLIQPDSSIGSDEDPLDQLTHDVPDELVASHANAMAGSGPIEVPEDSFFLLGLHIARLNFAIEFFEWTDVTVPYDFILKELQTEIASLNPYLPYKLRLLVRKNGDYEIQSSVAAHRADLFSGLDPRGSAAQSGPIYDVYVDPEPTMISPFTSFKTTNRAHYNAARQRMLPGLNPHGYEEVLLHNTKNEVTEGSITNVAFLRKDKWVTPLLPSGCLCGVTRHYLIKQDIITEGKILLSDVKDGEHILLFNAIIGVAKGIIRFNRPTNA